MSLDTPEGPEDILSTELERVGLVRRMFAARRWYGVDWWFVAISAVVLVFLFALALFPAVFAPHSPLAQVGPRLLAPGADPDRLILLTLEGSGIGGIGDLPRDGRVPYGVVAGSNASEAARDEADRLTQELSAAGVDERIRLKIERYDTPDEMLVALVDGDVLAAGGSSLALEPVLGDYPTVTDVGPIALEEGAVQQGGFLLGTNQLGQDVLSRLIHGTRVAFLIGFAAALAALVIGVPLGLLAGYAGGALDRGISLVMDSMYAFPGLILAIAITAVLGPSVLNVVVAISVLYIPTYYRIVCGQTMSVKEELYVEAARSIGARVGQVVRKYVFPNVIPSVAIIFSVNVADAILTGAALSFLGLGLPPSIPDWGADLNQGREAIQNAWWLSTFPGLAIMIVVLTFTMLGEGLMEIFNPKLRER